MRVRGGTNGILAAIDAGWLDDLDGNIIDVPNRPNHLSPSDLRDELRRLKRRLRRRAKAIASRVPF